MSGENLYSKNNKFYENNIKFLLIMGFIIILGIVGITYALSISNFRGLGIDTTLSDIDASILFEDGTSNITNIDNLFPISDDLVTVDSNDTAIMKAVFNVIGEEDNPKDTIFDIAFYDINMDCELKNEYFKWRLYRDGEDTAISEGSFSPKFDIMEGNRLVLTNTQEELTTLGQKYILLIWISDSCSGEDIANCDSSLSQEKYLNKNFSASIKIELSTKDVKENTRKTGSAVVCNYTEIALPVCNSATYDGTTHTLVNDGDNYTLDNNKGINAGDYAITVKIDRGFQWTDGTTTDKLLSCRIDRKSVVVTTLNQILDYNESVSSLVDNVTINGLVSGDSLESVYLYSPVLNKDNTSIVASNAVIVNSLGVNVNDNYDIIYNNTGVVIMAE